MTKVNLFSIPICKKFSASRFSMANVITIFGAAITFGVPIILALSSQPFQIQLQIYHEQPEVHFSYNAIVNLEAEDTNGRQIELFYSNIQQLNELRPNSFRAASMRALEVDNDHDGLNERLELILNSHLKKNWYSTPRQSFSYIIN
jgi:Carbohydrate (N-acetylglucosamine 6-O) sulfotransferase 5.